MKNTNSQENNSSSEQRSSTGKYFGEIEHLTGRRAIQSTKYLLDTLKTNPLVERDKREVLATMSRQIDNLPRSIVTPELSIDLSGRDSASNPGGTGGDIIVAVLTCTRGTIQFSTGGVFHGDTYFTNVYKVDLGSFETEGNFSGLVAWESIVASIFGDVLEVDVESI